jgi:L-ascorbate metabolism protein UlaG (beta-lactamase superfamily)
MIRYFALALICLALIVNAVDAKTRTDILATSKGDLKVTVLGHASLMFQFDGKTIHVDPFGKMADYSKLPKADLVLITHEHPDHLDLDALAKIKTEKTKLVGSAKVAEKVKDAVIMNNGDTKTVEGLEIRAVPAYNIVHKRDTGQPFHPKGAGNGYVIKFGDKQVYVAGDTEPIPEMKDLQDIEVAFLPVNLPYTMTGKMAAEAIQTIKPKIAYAYHYDMGTSQAPQLLELFKTGGATELRYKDQP